MKKWSYAFVILSFLFFDIQGQSKLTKQTWQQWFADEGGWVDMRIQDWTYDGAGRNTRYVQQNKYTADFVFSPFFFELEWTQRDSIFDNTGRLILSTEKMWDDSISYSTEIAYQYNNDGALSEQLISYWNSYTGEQVNGGKLVYEYEVIGDFLIVKAKDFTWDEGQNKYNQYQGRIDTYNGNGCKVESIINRYDDDLNFLSATKYKSYYDDNCTLLSQERYKQPDDFSAFLPQTKIDYQSTSLEDRVIQYRFENGTWLKMSEEVKIYQAIGQVVQHYLKAFTPFEYYDFFIEKVYNPQGDLSLETYHYDSSIDPNTNLFLAYKRTYGYKYNQEDQMTQKVIIYENGGGSIKTTESFDYYCNGQVKIKTVEQVPITNKYFYEYEASSDCDQKASTDNSITISPNPTNGMLRVNSDLLNSEHAQITILSIIGQTIWQTSVPDFTSFYILELPELPNGQYLMSISNEHTQKTESVILIR